MLRKVSTPIKKTASPIEKRKSELRIKSKLSKLSSKTVSVKKTKAQNTVQGGRQENLSDSQRTLWEIWGPEKSKDGPDFGK